MSVNATNPPVDRTTVLQSKLYQAAQRDPKRRFHALYDKLASSYVLQSAWELVRQNQGAAGIDQQTLADIEAGGVPEFLAEIAQSLRDKTSRVYGATSTYTIQLLYSGGVRSAASSRPSSTGGKIGGRASNCPMATSLPPLRPWPNNTA